MMRDRDRAERERGGVEAAAEELRCFWVAISAVMA
jgi:hypothetical protein